MSLAKTQLCAKFVAIMICYFFLFWKKKEEPHLIFTAHFNVTNLVNLWHIV
jgi:hypothetical protein